MVIWLGGDDGIVKSERVVNCFLNGSGWVAEGERRRRVKRRGVSGERCISYQRQRARQRRKGKCKRQAGCATGQPC
jgi:hypothetical protein